MGEYQLLYFNLRGRGQAVRYLFADNGIKYTEVNVCPDTDTWVKKFKPGMPFGQAPLLKDGDFELAQFNAILRYLGRKHDLHPSDVHEAALVDMVSDHIEDVRSAYVKLIYQTYDTEKENYIKGLPDKLKPLENLLTKWGHDFISKKISFADYNLLDLLEIHLLLAPGCLETFPTLKAFVDRMLARDGIKAFQETEAFKTMPVNGNGKQ